MDTSGYTFKHRSACRTPAESRQEYLTSGKKYIEPRKTRDQALNLWSGSTDSKTLDDERTHPREYHIELTQRKPLEYKTWHHPTSSSTLGRTPHLTTNKAKTNPVISRQEYHYTQPYPSEENQTNKQKFSTNLTLYKAHTNHWTNLRREETKRKNEFNLLQRKNSTFLEAWEKETSNTIP